MEIPIANLSDIPSAATKLLTSFRSQKVFAFFGEMGIGKTTLIKEICRQLGVKDNEMSSPTFALINEYKRSPAPTPPSGGAGGRPIFHFDFYRIKNEIEAFDLGFEDYFYSGNYCFIEWAEKIPNLLPVNCVKVQITVRDEMRKIVISE